MNIKKLKLAGIILFFLLGLIGCNKEDVLKISNEEFCMHLNSENMDETMPVINEYLGSQSQFFLICLI